LAQPDLPGIEPGERPGGPRSTKGARTRARLLEAAKRVFERDGFLEARISDIAQEAGLSHGSFYHYFDSKEEVFREVAEAVDEKLSDPLQSVIFDRTLKVTPRERIAQAVRRHLETYREEARIIGVIEQVCRYDLPLKQARSEWQGRYRGQVANSIRQMQRRGMADPELDPLVASTALGAMTTRFPELWLVDGELDCSFDKGVEQLTRVFVNGLGLRDPQDPS
jgi:AcrR family transcriptional regulator